MRVLLDTHVWLWWVTGAPELPRDEREALDRQAASSLPSIAAISLWETQMLVGKKRVIPVEPFERWMRRIASPDVVAVLPLDVDVVIALHALPRSFHGDPADRVIAATARAHDLVLATHDQTLRRSRAVNLWRA